MKHIVLCVLCRHCSYGVSFIGWSK